MSDQSEKVGYLTAALEALSRDIAEIKAMQAQQARQLDEVKDQLSMWKTTAFVMKSLALSAAFILAFKFGDIPDLWR